MGGDPRVVVSTAAFHARVRGSVPGLGGLKETKLFLPHPRVKVSIVGSLRDREVACSASDRQGSNFESCVWRTVSSQSSHHPQEVFLAQFSLYVHKGGLKPDSFHFILLRFVCSKRTWIDSNTFAANLKSVWTEETYGLVNRFKIQWQKVHVGRFDGLVNPVLVLTDLMRIKRSGLVNRLKTGRIKQDLIYIYFPSTNWYPSKHDTLNQCCFNVESASAILAQQWNHISLKLLVGFILCGAARKEFGKR